MGSDEVSRREWRNPLLTKFVLPVPVKITPKAVLQVLDMVMARFDQDRQPFNWDNEGRLNGQSYYCPDHLNDWLQWAIDIGLLHIDYRFLQGSKILVQKIRLVPDRRHLKNVGQLDDGSNFWIDAQLCSVGQDTRDFVATYVFDADGNLISNEIRDLERHPFNVQHTPQP